MLEDIPINNPTRDKEWGKWIRRKSVKAFMQDRSDFKFPLDGSYEIWCAAWQRAWDEGFKQGMKSHD